MIRLILKNILYRPIRNGALILSFAFIAASLFSGNYLATGVADSISKEISQLGADLIVVPEQYSAEGEAVLLRGEPSTFFFDRKVLDKVENVNGVVQAAPQIYIATLSADCCSDLVQLIAIDPVRDFTITPWLNQSRKQPLGKDEIIVGSQIVGDVGSTRYFYGHAFIIAGTLRPTGTGVDRTVFLRAEDARIMAAESAKTAYEPVTLPEGGISVILVKVAHPADAADISRNITEQVPGTKVITPGSLVSQVAGRLSSITRLLAMAAVIATLVTLPLVALISVMAAQERIHEIGILRALGATRAKIFGLIFGEAVVVAAAGGCIGIAISSVLLILFQEYIALTIGIPLSVPTGGSLFLNAAATVIHTTAIGGIAAILPAIKASGMDPSESIRSGDL